MTETDVDVVETRSPARKWGTLALRWLPGLVVVVGCIYLARTVDLSKLGASLLNASLWPLGLALVFAALGVVAHSAHWWVLVNTVARVSLREMTVYGFASYAANAFLPMRAGEALRVWLVQRKHGVPITLSAAIIAIEKMADVGSLLILVSPLPWLIPNLPPSVRDALRILPCIVLAAAVGVLIAGRHATRFRILKGFDVIRRPGRVAAGVGFVFVAWLFDLSAILSVLASVHIAPTLVKALMVILSVNIAVAIPATPGQVGTHELGSTFALKLLGVPEAQAIPFALFYHASQLLPILLIGLGTARALSRDPEAPATRVLDEGARVSNAKPMVSERVRSVLALLFTGVGLAASAALLVDYATTSPVFCAEGGGCDALRQTVVAHPLGIPLPAFGLLGFFVLAMFTVSRGPRVRLGNLVVAGIAGVAGLGLLGAQVAFGHFCPYCAAVDASAVLLAGLAWDRRRAAWDPPSGALPALGMAFGLSVAVVLPFAWASFAPRHVPPVIAKELAETPKGKVTIVDFVDYECPFCRQMQAKLAPQVEAEKDKVRVVRKLVPLTRIHPHALAAAKASCCADALGKGDAMADALFKTNIEDLTPEGCARLAEQLGLPLEKYNECVGSPDTDARLARDRQEFDQAASKGDGLPLLWVGPFKIMGAQDDATVARALGEAIARAGS